MAALSSVVSVVIRLYMLLIFLRVVLSWVNVNRYGSGTPLPLVQLLYRITDPILVPLRRIIPPVGGTVDIVPVVALFLLEIVRWMLLTLLSSL